ncbi:putative rossmann-like alpha/beta/alpha sandwich protein [Helianthus annuus]|nr:putative rossmann-like alpha/beta/alpha sandwich protein [Helianthus annuus]
MLGVNESSIKGYPHASISSKSAFEWTLKKIILGFYVEIGIVLEFCLQDSSLNMEPTNQNPNDTIITTVKLTRTSIESNTYDNSSE